MFMSLQIEDTKLAIGYVVVILHWLQYWIGLYVLQLPTATSDINENLGTKKKKSNFCLRDDIFTVSFCKLTTEGSDKSTTLIVCDKGIGNMQLRKETPMCKRDRSLCSGKGSGKHSKKGRNACRVIWQWSSIL